MPLSADATLSAIAEHFIELGPIVGIFIDRSPIAAGRLGSFMPTNLFSTYSTSENRVTSSILAVLRSLSMDRCQRLLGALLEKPEFELVRFQDQPSAGGPGVPDALIRASCSVLIETKLVPNALGRQQLERHLERLRGMGESELDLLALTPDVDTPRVIHEIGDPLISWASFAALDQAVEELLTDPQEVISEREAFLLRELQAMLAREGLVASAKDVLVVAASEAWPEYQAYSTYVCQPGRTFQSVGRMAFYTDGAIQPLVPIIREVHDRVPFERGLHDGALGAIVERLLEKTSRIEGADYKVMLLSGPDDPETGRLEALVRNDLRSSSGRTSAFTQGQRYVSWDRLQAASVTSELVEG
jgi:hypothetical protein